MSPISTHILTLDLMLAMVPGEVMGHLGGGALIDSTGVGFEALRLALH